MGRPRIKRSKAISFEDLQLGVEERKQTDWERFENEFLYLSEFLRLKNISQLKLKKMFGGLAIYRGPTLLLALMQDETERIWKGRRYPFLLWNGVLVATSREHHQKLSRICPSLNSHPVLGKWLYLRRSSRDWKKSIAKLTALILKNSDLIGVTSRPKT